MPGKCDFHPLTCAIDGAAGVAGDLASSAWDGVCRSFAVGAAQMLKAFGQAFAALPSLSLGSAGIDGVYGTCLQVAATVSALLVFGQVIRTAWTRDGTGLAEAVSGVAKTVVAWLVTVTVATAALEASDQLTSLIVNQSFGSQTALADRLGTVVNWAEVTGQPGQAIIGGSLLLVFGLAGIILVVVLWAELLLRNAAIAVLVAMSPVAAAGQASEATKAWWTRTASATVQLIILKPVIALVFAVGFGMAGRSSGIEQVLEGLLVLGLAAFSWPVIARFFTFASVQSSSGSGLAAAIGFLTGAASQGGGRGTAGVSPDQWSMSAEQQTMAGRGQAAGSVPGGAGGAGLPGAAGASGGGAAGGNGAGVLAGIGFALQKAQQAGAAASARMEQTAAHAGMHGAYPYSTVSGGPRQQLAGPRRQQGSTAPATEAEAEPSPPEYGSAPAGEFPPREPEPLAGRQFSEPPAGPFPPSAPEGGQ